MSPGARCAGWRQVALRTGFKKEKKERDGSCVTQEVDDFGRVWYHWRKRRNFLRKERCGAESPVLKEKRLMLSAAERQGELRQQQAAGSGWSGVNGCSIWASPFAFLNMFWKWIVRRTVKIVEGKARVRESMKDPYLWGEWVVCALPDTGAWGGGGGAVIRGNAVEFASESGQRNWKCMFTRTPAHRCLKQFYA